MHAHNIKMSEADYLAQEALALAKSEFVNGEIFAMADDGRSSDD
jgi:hypothetical protein